MINFLKILSQQLTKECLLLDDDRKLQKRVFLQRQTKKLQLPQDPASLKSSQAAAEIAQQATLLSGQSSVANAEPDASDDQHKTNKKYSSTTRIA